MEITIRIPKPLALLARFWAPGLLLIGAAVVAMLVVLSARSPSTLEATDDMPCPDLDGNGLVTFADINIEKSYLDKAVPTAPAQADMKTPDGTIDSLNDLLYVITQYLTFTDCQDKPVGFQGPQSQIIISKLSIAEPPGACFEVFDNTQSSLFTVCDNNYQGPPDTHAVCNADGTQECEDSDLDDGSSITVTVDPGQYSLQEIKAPVNHNADDSKLACDISGGGICAPLFVNMPNNNPWFPWDVAGSPVAPGVPGPGDGYVDLFNDILGVIGHYQERKPTP